MAERTEGAALSGTLHLTIGGRERELPVLKLRQSKDWKARLGQLAADIEVDDHDLAAMLARAATLPAEIGLDLLVAYDVTDVLGGRDAIEEAATDGELFEALKSLVTVTFPFETGARSVVEAFGPQLRGIVQTLLGRIAVRLLQASSTPTPSDTGDSTPTSSSGDTPTSSSSSSGPTTSAPDSTTPGSDET